jgi:lipopolysaccharide export system ATP-binding protein
VTPPSPSTPGARRPAGAAPAARRPHEVSENATVLRARALTKSYGRRVVVNGVDVEVRTGEVVGLLGPNGAGKTTTFYMVVGLTRPDSGQVFLGDADITDLPMYRRARQGIGYLPQEASIFRKLTAEENVLAILETLGLPPSEQRTRARALLEELGILSLGRQPAYTLSGGERRRLEICRALATRPSFILLDEPFAGIDPIAVSDIQGIVAHLKDRRIGVLVTDHNVRETLKITDRAYILREGEVFRSGTPRELASDPEVRRVYLGETFQLDEPAGSA